MSFCLVTGYQVDPVSFQPSSSQAHPASIARLSLRLTLGRPLYCIFPLIFRHSQSRSSRFLLLCVLLLSSQPTLGSIQFFDSFFSHSQPCLFSFHCFPCAVISHPLDPSSVTLPSFQTSVVSSLFPCHFLPGLPLASSSLSPHQRSIHSRIVLSRLYSRFSQPVRQQL